MKEENMTDIEVIDLFDQTNITLRRLSEISGRSVEDLKLLLMDPDPKWGVTLNDPKGFLN